MANWKKVIVSGSIAELAQVTASTGMYIPTSSLIDGSVDNYVLTVDDGGSVTRRDPKTIGAAFQSMSIAGDAGLGDFGEDIFIAQPGLNELIFVSGSNVELATSQSLNDTASQTIGYIRITALTSSVAATLNQTTVSDVSNNVYTIGTVQSISTGSHVTFADISGSKLSIITGSTTDNNLASFKSTTNKANISIEDHDTKVYASAENGRASFGANNTPFSGNLNINILSSEEGEVGNVGIGTKYAPEKLTVRGNISASGDLLIDGDIEVDGALGVGGSVFGLTGFGVTIDDIAITSGSVNFGSGSLPSNNTHKFTGSLIVTGSGLTLVDGVFSGDGNSLTNLDADNIVNTRNLTWGYGITSSNGSAYSITSSITLNMHISGSEITSSEDGLYIPGRTLRVDQFTSSAAGGIISWYSGSTDPYVIPIGTKGQVLTVTGFDTDHHTASFQDLPPTLALGIETGSVNSNLGNGVSLILTSSLDGAIVSEIPVSGSDNQISVSGSFPGHTNIIHLRLADDISNIQTVTASVGIKTEFVSANDISASGNVTIAGDLSVLGDTTLLHTTNLLVEDAFVTLASGSSQTDGGIIVQTGAGGGKGFGWDNTIGRWGLQDGLLFDATNLLPTEFMVSAFLSSSNPSVNTLPTYGQAATKKQSSGQLWINTGSGDIWIYVD